MRSEPRDEALERAIKKAGGTGALAAILGISQAAVSQWKRCPANRAIAVEKATKVSRKALRPDVFRDPDPSPRSDEAA